MSFSCSRQSCCFRTQPRSLGYFAKPIGPFRDHIWTQNRPVLGPESDSGAVPEPPGEPEGAPKVPTSKINDSCTEMTPKLGPKSTPCALQPHALLFAVSTPECSLFENKWLRTGLVDCPTRRAPRGGGGLTGLRPLPPTPKKSSTSKRARDALRIHAHAHFVFV